MVNGLKYDWEELSAMLPSGLAVGITELNYSDEKPVQPRHGKGSVARGYGRKNYKATGNMTLDRDEFERLRISLGGSVYRAKPFPIVSNYGENDLPPITDTLPACKITKVDISHKQDDDNTGQVKLDFEILEPIKWNGVSAY